MRYPNLQSEYTVGNDVTDAFHDSEVAVIAYAATNSIKFNNPEELGASGFDISSPFNTDKHAFQLLNSVYLRIRINSNAMWKISSSQNLEPISVLNSSLWREGYDWFLDQNYPPPEDRYLTVTAGNPHWFPLLSPAEPAVLLSVSIRLAL